MTAQPPYRTPAVEEPVPPRPWLLTTALTPVVLVANVVVSGWATMVHPILGIFVPCLVALGWSIGTVMGRDGSVVTWFATLLLLATAGLGSSFTGAAELTLWLPGGDRTPAELPAHGWARAFTLHDAETRPMLSGTHRVRSKKSTTTYTVMPLVPPGWTAASPVPAWAVCPDATCQTVPAQPRFGFRPASLNREDHVKASAQAASSHALQVAPGAPVLEVSGSAREVIAARTRMLGGVIVFLGVPWLLAVAVERVQARRRRARERA